MWKPLWPQVSFKGRSAHCGIEAAYEGERYRDAIDSGSINAHMEKALPDDLGGAFI